MQAKCSGPAAGMPSASGSERRPILILAAAQCRVQGHHWGGEQARACRPLCRKFKLPKTKAAAGCESS